MAERLRDKKMRMELSDAAVDYLAVRRAARPPPLEPPRDTRSAVRVSSAL